MSKKFLLELINCLQNEPALWQANSKAYKSKNSRNKAWEKLLTKYKEIDEHATIDTVKKKVNSLRASYRREIHKINNSEKSGAGAMDIYKPTLWYFQKLHFLYDQESLIDDKPEIDMPKTPTKLPTKRKCEDNPEVLQINAVAHNTNTKKSRDDADVYAEGWAVMFRQLSEEQQLFAKKGIDELLMQGRLNMLTYRAVSSIANLQIKRNSDPLDDELM